MNKNIFLLILVTIMLLLGACDIDSIELSDNIETPKNNTLPLSGLWEIRDYTINITSDISEDDAETYLGREALFSSDFVSLGEEFSTQPSYRIRIVDAEEYLIYHYKTTPELLDIEADEIQVISVTGTEQFFYDFIKISEDTIIVNLDGAFFYFNKVSESAEPNKVLTKESSENILFDVSESSHKDTVDTGILLGLKSLDLENHEEGIERWNYRTIFIRGLDKEVASINEMDDILLPRRTGFWKVKINRKEKDGIIDDIIEAYPLNRSSDGRMEEESNTIKNILYVGNDYISIENIQYRNKGERFLEFYPIDSIGLLKPLMIGDVLGEAGKEAFLEGASREVLNEREEYKNRIMEFRTNEESFGLFRRNGHWIFKGRINFTEKDKYSYESFNINVVPPKEIVYYDELAVPWNKIKSAVPEAIDCFTSPNEDLAIIITHGHVLVYELDDSNIGNRPIEKIKLLPSERIIMAEWAVGRYPKLWEDEFLK